VVYLYGGQANLSCVSGRGSFKLVIVVIVVDCGIDDVGLDEGADVEIDEETDDEICTVSFLS
jgi:hypothetical protein